jgi:hypothetical protein
MPQAVHERFRENLDTRWSEASYSADPVSSQFKGHVPWGQVYHDSINKRGEVRVRKKHDAVFAFGGSHFRRTDQAFPCQTRIKIPAQKARTAAFVAFCSSFRYRLDNS